MTVHTIIHLLADIWNCGPAWVHWVFMMEQEVQWCKTQVRDSQKEPFAHLTCKVLHHEQIQTITLHFNLENELDIQKQVKGDRDGPKGMTYESCMYHPYVVTGWTQLATDNDYEFLPPSRWTIQLTDSMQEEVAQFVVVNCDAVLPNISVAMAMCCVPRDGVKWGKMTVNGERITASWAYQRDTNQRCANYVRYHVLFTRARCTTPNHSLQLSQQDMGTANDAHSTVLHPWGC